MSTGYVLALSKSLLAAAVLALGLPACAEEQQRPQPDSSAASPDTAGEAPARRGGVVQVRQSDRVGPYLTDGNGRTLYLFRKDRKGSNQSTCTDACAQAWPPFTTPPRAAPSARGEAQRNLLGTFQRADGAQQITYDGWPLYRFAQGRGAGDLQGQAVEGFGGEWYALTPEGDEARGE